MAPSGELLTSPEVSRLLNISIRTVHRRAESGELPHAHKLPGPNGAYLFRREDVEAFAQVTAGRTGQPVAS